MVIFLSYSLRVVKIKSERESEISKKAELLMSDLLPLWMVIQSLELISSTHKHLHPPLIERRAINEMRARHREQSSDP